LILVVVFDSPATSKAQICITIHAKSIDGSVQEFSVDWGLFFCCGHFVHGGTYKIVSTKIKKRECNEKVKRSIKIKKGVNEYSFHSFFAPSILYEQSTREWSDWGKKKRGNTFINFVKHSNFHEKDVGILRYVLLCLHVEKRASLPGNLVENAWIL
jgi:hypothetical protein